jgi:hypothetical protein
VLQACKSLAATKSVGRDAELVLESVLGEGSYGKVRVSSGMSHHQSVCSPFAFPSSACVGKPAWNGLISSSDEVACGYEAGSEVEGD